ncbi:MAG: hypothetical protein U0903_06995 [Planctomycetales bacterium]
MNPAYSSEARQVSGKLALTLLIAMSVIALGVNARAADSTRTKKVNLDNAPAPTQLALEPGATNQENKKNDDKKDDAKKDDAKKNRDNKPDNKKPDTKTPNTGKGNSPNTGGGNASGGNKNNSGNPQGQGNNKAGQQGNNSGGGNKGNNNPQMNKGNTPANPSVIKLPNNTTLPGNSNKLPSGGNMPNKGSTGKGSAGNKNIGSGGNSSNLGKDLSKQVKLDKLPVAPKPDLKLPKNPSGDPKISLDLNKNPMGKDLGKIQLEHHQDFKNNKFLTQPLSKLPVEKNGAIKPDNLKKLNLGNHKPDFAQQFQSGKFNQLLTTKDAQQLQLKQQFQLLGTGGDLARRMNLAHAMQINGGWQARKLGFVSSAYLVGAHSMMYCGPSYYPAHCWYPGWSPWVDWCWWDHCNPIWDPRPIFCRPIVYAPCPAWVYWKCPVWQPLPIVTCGTWIDAPLVTVANTDVQMLAVRFVDPGHPEQGTGPRYRVWYRNNSPFRINQPFNVMLFAGNDRILNDGLPQAGVRVSGMEAGQIQTVDIRLPEAVNHLARDLEGNAIPFNFLNVLTDSMNELPDTFRPNNGATLARGDVLPVDPASFAADPFGTGVGGIINIAGEGFGPEPGQVLIQMGGLELQGEIEGWFDLGIRIRIPNVPLTASATANIVVVRGDGAVANPLSVEIAPADGLSMR